VSPPFTRFIPMFTHPGLPVVTLSGLFGPQPHPHHVAHIIVTALSEHDVTVSRALPDEHTGKMDNSQDDIEGPSCILFDYAIHTLGSKLPVPIDLRSAPEEDENVRETENPNETIIVPQGKVGTKKESVAWLQASQASRLRVNVQVCDYNCSVGSLEFQTDDVTRM
jgi:hypothetical protein